MEIVMTSIVQMASALALTEQLLEMPHAIAAAASFRDVRDCVSMRAIVSAARRHCQ